MTKINKILIFFVAIIVSLTLILLVFAVKQTKNLQRDPSVLMDRYHLIKKKNPEAAKHALTILLEQDENYIPALKELSHIYLKERNPKAALPLMEKLHELEPGKPEYTSQLSRLYNDLGEKEKVLEILAASKSQQQVNTLISFVAPYRLAAHIFALPHIKQVEAQNQSYMLNIFLNFYYQLKNESQAQANEWLSSLFLLFPESPTIALEMGYAALKNKDYTSAIDYFSLAYLSKPSSSIAMQLAYLHVEQKNYSEASQFFQLALWTSNDHQTKSRALKGYLFAKKSTTFDAEQVTLSQPAPPVPLRTLLFDQFFAAKKENKDAAWELIQKIISLYPNDVMALKEGGYLAVEKGYCAEAIIYFTHAYNITHEPAVAMQLGYLYDQTSDKYTAYQYFKLATLSSDKTLELKAQNALTNLAGLQTKVLPSPYFGEIFFTPFTQSRFGLTVRPLIARLGIENNDRWQSKFYFLFRQTDDNRSASLGQIPQIYEDNVRILGGGVLITPIRSFPMVAFLEAGMAYDLVYRNRDRWRPDVRGGLMYYKEVGAKPAYFDHLKIDADYYGVYYGDVTYFSRFNNNVIGTAKTNQGIHLLQYKSSMVNVYFTARVLQDTNREFFNNIGEIGPGVGFIPSNRFPIQVRFEHINGVYLPAGGSFNPYSKYYTNDMVQLLYYVRI